MTPPFGMSHPRFLWNHVQGGDRMDWIRGLFSAQPGLNRVQPAGLVLMVAGAIAAIFVSSALEKRAVDRRWILLCRLGGLMLACVGALVAIH